MEAQLDAVRDHPGDIMMDHFNRWLANLQPILAAALDAPAAETIVARIIQEFKALYPLIPDIGGEENALTPLLLGSAHWLALYRAARSEGIQVEEVGTWIGQYQERTLMLIPPEKRREIGAWQFTPAYLEEQKRLADRSQIRRYPEDWVFTIFAGDGVDFDYGMDCTECAILKFYTAHGVPELTPYLCRNDFYTSEALELGLERAHTLAEGASHCNFRYRRGRPTHVPPPRR